MSDPGAAPRRLRILVLNWLDRENPQAGGAEEHLHETFGRLVRRGHRVSALVSGWPGCSDRVELDGIEIHRTGGRYTFSLAAPRYYRRHLRAEGFDVIVEDLNKVPLFSPWWADVPAVALVHHLFGATAFREAALPLATATWLLERGIPRAFRDRPAVAVSESTRLDLARRGLDPERVEVVHNGIDLDAYTPHPDGARFAEPTLLYLGRLKRYKSVELVIEAVARLAERGVEARLLVGGRGDHARALERLVHRRGLGDRVELLGFVSHERKVELFRKSWIHVLTSPKEGWGIANVEAAACGTPTVSSDSPGLRESVVHDRTGLLVPHGDVGALADALAELLGDAPRRLAMGRAARTFAEEHSWDATADGMERFLFRVVAPRRRD